MTFKFFVFPTPLKCSLLYKCLEVRPWLKYFSYILFFIIISHLSLADSFGQPYCFHLCICVCVLEYQSVHSSPHTLFFS